MVGAGGFDVEIDGSLGEGGGQVVRMSLAFSSVLDRSVRVTRVRAGRNKPGLQAQHAQGAELLARICGGQICGATIGSHFVTLAPACVANSVASSSSPQLPTSTLAVGCGDAQWQPKECSVGTAGAVSLVTQAALPAALRFVASASTQTGKPDPKDSSIKSSLSPSLTFTVRGGTSVPFSPTSDYVQLVLAPNLHTLFGIRLDYIVKRHGFFPRGGGECEVFIEKSNCEPALDVESSRRIGYFLRPCNIESRGNVLRIEGLILVRGDAYVQAGLPAAMQWQAAKTLRAFARNDDAVVADVSDDSICIREIRADDPDASADNALVITLTATTECGTVLGSTAIWSEREASRQRNASASASRADVWRQSAAHVADTVAQELCTAIASGAAVDSHMADQVCIYMAMAKGTSRLLVPTATQHLLSVVDVAKQFDVDIQLLPVDGSSNSMMCCNGKGIMLR